MGKSTTWNRCCDSVSALRKRVWQHRKGQHWLAALFMNLLIAAAALSGGTYLRMGITRDVILWRRYAIKLPVLTRGWRLFLHGLTSNMQEVTWYCGDRPPSTRLRYPDWHQRLCPIVYHWRGGFLVVMLRARPLTMDEWAAFSPARFCENEDGTIPVETKKDSFGILDGRIVAVDYGS